jgi:hypothetical protein
VGLSKYFWGIFWGMIGGGGMQNIDSMWLSAACFNSTASWRKRAGRLRALRVRFEEYGLKSQPDFIVLTFLKQCSRMSE